MKLWGLPPNFGVYPISILKTDLADHLKLTYIILYALAWRNDHKTVLQSTEQLAELFSELEGERLQARGMRKRLELLSKAGLVDRVKTRGRWMTVLRLRHGTGGVSSGTPECHIYSNDVDAIDSLIHQQQDSICGTDSASEEIRISLWEAGIWEPTCSELAELEWVTCEYVDGLVDFMGNQMARGKKLGTGWLVEQIRAGHKAPARSRNAF